MINFIPKHILIVLPFSFITGFIVCVKLLVDFFNSSLSQITILVNSDVCNDDDET